MFSEHLQYALDISEAKRMLRDDKKPFATATLLGWQVSLYDDTGDDRALASQDNPRLPTITAKIKKFVDSSDLSAVMTKLINTIRSQKPRSFETLQALKKPVGALSDAELNAVSVAAKAVFDGFLLNLASVIGLTERDLAVVNMRNLANYNYDANESALKNVISNMGGVMKKLPEAPTSLIAHTKKIDKSQSMTADSLPAKKALTAVNAVLTRAQALGIRKSAAVPIRIHFDKRRKHDAGDADPGRTTGRHDTHRINIYITDEDDAATIAQTLAHEIGHILFAVNKDVQRSIKTLAHDAGSKAPSEYGDVNYMRHGAREPSKHHQSGNEWMAEMFRLLVIGEPLSEFSRDQLRQFKTALATINGHPHAGIIYRN